MAHDVAKTTLVPWFCVDGNRRPCSCSLESRLRRSLTPAPSEVGIDGIMMT